MGKSANFLKHYRKKTKQKKTGDIFRKYYKKRIKFDIIITCIISHSFHIIQQF